MAQESNSSNSSIDNLAEGGAVETMLDRPVAQVARFVGASLVFFLRGFYQPIRIGFDVARETTITPPPFAWLVGALFATGVTFRLWFAMMEVPPHVDESFIDDLRTAIGDLSMTRVLLITFPCVLMVALGAALFSRMLGRKPRLDRDTMVTAACYAVGWQFCIVAMFFGLLIMVNVCWRYYYGGMEEISLNDELNAGIPIVLLIAFIWGPMILTPVMRFRLPGHGVLTWPAGFVASAIFTAPLFVSTMWVLGQSVDLHAAAAIAQARQDRIWFGDLDADVLSTREHSNELRYEIVVAFTNRADRMLILPRSKELLPKQHGRLFRVVECSLDNLPDRSLLIESSETRVVEYVLELQPTMPLDSNANGYGNPGYAITFFRREPDGGFLQGEAILRLPSYLAKVNPNDWRYLANEPTQPTTSPGVAPGLKGLKLGNRLIGESLLLESNGQPTSSGLSR